MTRQKYLDMTAIPTSRARAQAMTCAFCYISFCVLAGAALAGAVILPIAVKVVTAATVWISMALEAASIGACFAARWIKQNAILGNGHE